MEHGQPVEDVLYHKIGDANVVFLGGPEQAGWVLLDTGASGHTEELLQAAAERFGEQPPECILLTHAHLDHIGGLRSLLERWSVPVYAHPFEFPSLEASQDCEGPHWLRLLPPDGVVPALPEWRWIHTPGHSPGHVSYWRERDGLLLSGDAFLTTRQDTAYGEWTEPVLDGPPQESTADWSQAQESLRRLAELPVQKVVCGHGQALDDAKLGQQLLELAENLRASAAQ